MVTVASIERGAVCGDLNGDGYDDTVLVASSAELGHGVFVADGAPAWNGRYTFTRLAHAAPSLCE